MMLNGTKSVGLLVSMNSLEELNPSFGLIVEKLVKSFSIDHHFQEWVPMVLLF
jgi:hypothetical protein